MQPDVLELPSELQRCVNEVGTTFGGRSEACMLSLRRSGPVPVRFAKAQPESGAGIE